MNVVPKARTDDLVVEHIEGELVVYDLRSDRAHSLTASAAAVFRAADGTRDLDALAELLPAEVALEARRGAIAAIVGSLAEAGLLETQVPPTRRLDRRRMLRVLGTGASAAVVTLAVPSPAAAQSCRALMDACGGGAACCPGLICVLGICVSL